MGYSKIMKVALVHDWLVKFGGAEKVLEAMSEVYPSKIYTLVADREGLKGSRFEDQEIKTSFIQKLPRAKKKYRSYLPFFPLAIEQFDLSDYDLIISSSHSIAKGVLTHADQFHVCYCHTPMRYAWDLYQQYLREAKLKSGPKGVLAKFFLHYLRIWDAHAASRVNVYVANSEFVARRIQKLYGQESTVIYPPVDVESFELCETKEGYYLTAARFVPYKKIDMIVETFQHFPDRKLVVIGDGPDMEKIKAKAGKNVELLGYQDDQTLKGMLKKARAFLYAAVEDFGILPVEAQACGTPVIAYGKGGVCETIAPNQTGVFFEQQTPEALGKAIQDFEKSQDQFDPKVIHSHVQPFALARFQNEFKTLVEEKYQAFLQRDSY